MRVFGELLVSNPQPVEGKCNARTRDTREDTGERGYCGSTPRSGAKRCRMHGSGSAERPGGAPIKHGLHSKHFQRLGEEGRQRLDELMADPKLLDPRRGVALSQVALEHVPLEPDDAAVKALARARHVGAGEPSEAEMASARDALRMDVALKLVDASAKHVRSQLVAHRAEKVTAVILDGAMPILERFAERVAGLIGKHLPPSQQAAFLADLRTQIQVVVAEISSLGHDIEAEES